MCTHSKILLGKIQLLTFGDVGLINQTPTVEIFGLQLLIISKILKNTASYVGVRPYLGSGLIPWNVI